MEIALRSDIPTYAGGLGVLAGDTMRSAADLCILGVGNCEHFSTRFSSGGLERSRRSMSSVQDAALRARRRKLGSGPP